MQLPREVMAPGRWIVLGRTRLEIERPSCVNGPKVVLCQKTSSHALFRIPLEVDVIGIPLSQRRDYAQLDLDTRALGIWYDREEDAVCLVIRRAEFEITTAQVAYERLGVTLQS